MARIPEHFVQDLLARTNLVEVIDERVPLKKSGRNYMACCPFHNEKTPSFTVAPDKQFYYCFGCGASGNAVGFLMEYERMGFQDAVKQLAGRAGLEVPLEQDNPQQKQRKSHLETLYELLARADHFYRQQLKSAPERQAAVDYLKTRGVSGEIAKAFGLGFAPPGFDNLITTLSLDQQGIELALEAGLLVRREDTGRTYDKFRERILFPIRDTRGRTLGFGGRVLGDGKPKYLNSPETPVFHKGEELYGLYEWRQSRDKSDYLFVVEGYMDVIALAQHGIANSVATLGTATSETHVRKLFHQVDTIVFCFDGDDAGRRAAWRALESCLPVLDDGKQARFLFLPEGEDPDTLVRREGREALLAASDQAPSLSRFLFDHLAEPLNTETLDGRARLARLTLPFIQKTRGDFYRNLLRRELAELTRLTEDELMRLEQPMQQTSPAVISPQNAPQHAPQHTPAPPGLVRRDRSFRGNVQVSLAERLTLTLLNTPEVARDCPLPEGIEELELPHLDLLIEISTRIKHNPDITTPALVGSLMAMEEGELIAELMTRTLQQEHSDEVAQRYWQEGLAQLEVWLLEHRLALAEQTPEPDPLQLQQLTHQLAAARNRRTGPVD